MAMKIKLRALEIKGFKSFDSEGQTIPFGDITVLLGANGSGKSNLIAFLRMLRSMARGEFSDYIGKEGANRLLFYGIRKTKGISFKIFFENDADIRYEAEIKRELPNALYISSESISFSQSDPLKKSKLKQKYRKSQTDAGAISDFRYMRRQANGESGIINDNSYTANLIRNFLAGLKIYQFNDTSEIAPIRDRVYLDDAYGLKHDGGNLASFLSLLKNNPAYEKYYQRIVLFIQSVMPQFKDFVLEPLPADKNYVRLNWRDNSGHDFIFDPHQLSDGSLRFIALATALLQPPEFLPTMLVLDEPELGLHPWAIANFDGMLKIAAQHCQILVATQSMRMLDELDPESLVLVKRDPQKNCSIFTSQNQKQLKSWLKNYTLSELWEKNVLEGNP